MNGRLRLTRRTILRAGASAALGIPELGRLAFAEPSSRPLLVLVHLRGGCDGLNLVSPANDPDFVAARASELRVLDDGPDAGHHLANGPSPALDFRLHAAAKRLAELYDAKQLAIIHAAGLSTAQRSHFVAIDMMDRGVADPAALSRVESGWLGRYVRAAGMAGAGASVTAAPALAGELRGAADALAIPDLNGGFGVPGGPQAEEVLSRLYAGAGGDVGAAGRATLGAVHLIDARVPRDAAMKPRAYEPAPGVNYDPGGDLGRALRTVAQLAKMEIGLVLATVDIGGWDTHEGQPGRFKNGVERLSNGIGAFWDDLYDRHDRTIVVVLSEFGRRLRSNRSAGTDHGRGGVMAVLGGQVAGGRFHGKWPGLAAEKLDEGVDLAVATDYRQVLTEIVAAQSGAAPPDLFPAYRSPGPLGLFRRSAPRAVTPRG
jgi:uncharacterized protein (DUF1501 family)